MKAKIKYPATKNQVRSDSDSVHHFTQYCENIRKKEYDEAQQTRIAMFNAPTDAR